MTASLRPSVPDLADAAQRDAFFAVAAAAARADGADPFNEQTRLDLAAGRRTPYVLRTVNADGGEEVAGAAVLGGGELDLVVAPAWRRRGLGRAAVEALLADVTGPVGAWAHGDHPGAARLAERTGFARVRTLLKLGRSLEGEVAEPTVPPGHSIAGMRTGADDAEWVELNARVFASHPEQGRLTLDDLHDRQAEPWFDPDDVLLLRDADGRLIGYDWVKVDAEAPAGEIYVLGVAPESAGRGLGRALLQAGLRRLRERGRRSAELYVEGDSAAVALYRSAGFTDLSVDVHYLRR